jgi:hypothetical protein
MVHFLRVRFYIEEEAKMIPKSNIVRWMFPRPLKRYSVKDLVIRHRPSSVTDFIFALEQAVTEGYINRELWVVANDGTKLEVHESIQTVPNKIHHPKTGEQEIITPENLVPYFYRSSK